MKNITALKNSLEGFNRRLDQVEEKTSKLNDRSSEIIEAEKLKMYKSEESKEAYGTLSCGPIYILCLSQKEK